MTRKCTHCKTAPTDTKRGKYCAACRQSVSAANNQKFINAVWPNASRNFGKETR